MKLQVRCVLRCALLCVFCADARARFTVLCAALRSIVYRVPTPHARATQASDLTQATSLGYGVLPLCAATVVREAEGEALTLQFSTVISLGGLIVGNLTGQLHFKWGQSQRARDPSASETSCTWAVCAAREGLEAVSYDACGAFTDASAGNAEQDQMPLAHKGEVRIQCVFVAFCASSAAFSPGHRRQCVPVLCRSMCHLSARASTTYPRDRVRLFAVFSPSFRHAHL